MCGDLGFRTTGGLQYFKSTWAQITSDNWVLDAIQEVKIECKMDPFQTYP